MMTTANHHRSLTRVGTTCISLLLILGGVSICTGAQDAAPEADEHTLALWRLNEARNGATPDATTHRHDGRLHGPKLTTRGRFGKALMFDGKDDYVDCGPGPDLGAGDFTVEAWFKTTNQDSPYGCIVGLYGSADLWLAVTKHGAVRFGFRDTEGNINEQQEIGSGLNLNDGRYHHFAGVRAGSRNLIYVDGKLLASHVVEGVGSLTSDASWMIGSLTKADWPFAGVIDEVRISRVARVPRPQWQGFLPGNGLEDCRVDLPLYLYFSMPMDASRRSPVSIFDVTEGSPFEHWEGRYPGDHSCFEIKLRKPLHHGHQYRIDFSRGREQFQSSAGAPFDPSHLPPLQFRTHEKGTPPRPLYVRFRNDNTHVTVEGMERMLAHGMDLIEFNLVYIKDGWISNHLERPDGVKRKVNVLMPGRTVPEGKKGDREGFRRIKTEPFDTLYETYASIDYVDVDDGKIDRIPRWEELLEVIQRWDRPIHLQIEGPGATREDFVRLFRESGLDLARVHSWHSDGATRNNLPLSKSRETRSYLFYPPKGRGMAEGFTAEDERFPNGMTPFVIRQAHERGRCTWLYSRVTRPAVTMAARLGIQYMCENNLAYKGDLSSRQTLYELNDYDGNRPPAVQSVTVDDQPLARRSGISRTPRIALRFTDTMESRSVNYRSVTLHPVGSSGEQSVPLHFDAHADFRSFGIRPQKELSAGTEYRLRIGGSSTREPVDLAGLSLASSWQTTFTTEQ